MLRIALSKALGAENKGSIRPALRSRQFFFDVDYLLRSGAGFIIKRNTMAHVSLRLMRQEDIPAVSDIGARCYNSSYYESDESFLSKWCGYPKGCYVVAVRGKVVAYAITFPYFKKEVFPLNSMYTPFFAPTGHYFHDVSVCPGYRKQGYAGMLVNKVWNSSPLPKSLVAVNNSQEFWERYGFKETRKVKYGKSKASYMECV